MKGLRFVTPRKLVLGAVVTLACSLPSSPAASSVVAWGLDADGQTDVPADLTNVQAIAAGSTGLALKGDGTFVTWGWLYIWDYGYVTNTVPGGLAGVIAIAAGGNFNLALKNDGTVVTWSVPRGSVYNAPVWTNVVAIASGNAHTLALANNGRVVGWGNNQHGAISVPPDLTNAVAIAAGAAHSLALQSDGRPVAWGNLGVTDLGQTNVPDTITNAVAIAAGHSHSLALTADGSVIAWGYNYYGQTNVPPGLSNVVAIAAGTTHNLALKRDGTVIAWGYNNYGQTNVPPLSNVVAIAAGDYHNLALVDVAPPQLKAGLANPSYNQGVFSVTVPTRCGQVYALEFNDTLVDSNWSALPLVAGTGGLQVLSDPTAGGSRRFYRVRQW